MMASAVSAASARPGERCLFFVDGSNLWIEAQKYAAQGNPRLNIPKLDGDRDPRVRIDAGKLVQTIAGGREKVANKSFYYGSRPPPNDSVWKALENLNFRTNIYDKNYQGKEKEVDGAMGADITAEATELRVLAQSDERMQRLKDATTFVCITGDRDLLPSIRKALEASIRVELWAWKDGLSLAYRQLNCETDLLSVRYIDSIFGRVFFTNYFSTLLGRDGRGPAYDAVDPARTIVLRNWTLDAWGVVVPEPSLSSPWVFSSPSPSTKPRRSVRQQLQKCITNELMFLGKLYYLSWSQQHAIDTTTYARPGELCISFPNVATIDDTLATVCDLFYGKVDVVSYPVYAGSLGAYKPVIETSNKYAPLASDSRDLCEDLPTALTGPSSMASSLPVPELSYMLPFAGLQGHHSNSKNNRMGSSPADDNSDAGTWHVVRRSDVLKNHHSGQRRHRACPHGIRCHERGECGFQHSAEQLRLFRDRPTINFAMWKTAPCRDPARCRNGRNCSFAHTRSEAWCTRCRHEGHYITECVHRRGS